MNTISKAHEGIMSQMRRYFIWKEKCGAETYASRTEATRRIPRVVSFHVLQHALIVTYCIWKFTDPVSDPMLRFRTKRAGEVLQLPALSAGLHLHPRVFPGSSFRSSPRCIPSHAKHGGWPRWADPFDVSSSSWRPALRRSRSAPRTNSSPAGEFALPRLRNAVPDKSVQRQLS